MSTLIQESASNIPELVLAKPYLIEQKYSDYSADTHEVWAELVERRLPQLEAHAVQEYMDGYEIIGLRSHRIPNLTEISQRLAPRTGWNSTPVSGFLPGAAFFEMLTARKFPTTTWLRSRDSLEYTPEPDIFHDVFGHVPMHAHPVFANFLQHYGSVCGKLEDPQTLEILGRLFWYTVEFGVMQKNGKIKVYGSGLISSHGECTRVIEGNCAIRKFQIDEVLGTQVKVDEMHQVLFAIESFDQLYVAMQEVEKRLQSGSIEIQLS